MAKRRFGHSALHLKNGKLEKIDPHPPADKESGALISWCKEMAAWCEMEDTPENTRQFTEQDRLNWLACAERLSARSAGESMICKARGVPCETPGACGTDGCCHHSGEAVHAPSAAAALSPDYIKLMAEQIDEIAVAISGRAGPQGARLHAIAGDVRRLGTQSASAGRHEPDCAFADRIERELKELQAFKEDRGDPEYWVLQTFVANADRICAALRASRFATGMFDAVQLSEARFYRNTKEPIGILARAILRANGEMP